MFYFLGWMDQGWTLPYKEERGGGNGGNLNLMASKTQGPVWGNSVKISNLFKTVWVTFRETSWNFQWV